MKTKQNRKIGIKPIIAFVNPIENRKMRRKECMEVTCGNPLRDWAINCRGERGYLCEICGYHTWVSYKTVDKKYRRNGGTVR